MFYKITGCDVTSKIKIFVKKISVWDFYSIMTVFLVKSYNYIAK